jgi:hypothetical protein
MSQTTESNLAPILTALAGPGVAIPMATGRVPNKPGLYAIYGGDDVWAELELGENPDGRPLYVGKAESSLRDRDLRQHFANARTGSSTLRRSFAALLRDRLDLHAMPRNPSKPAYFATYGLPPKDDVKLTEWMSTNLSIATWAWDGTLALVALESQALGAWQPPLNLSGVETPWSTMLSGRRAALAAEARAWRPSR